MRLVVDTNIVTAGLIKKSITRRLLLNPELALYTPEHVLGEIEKHKGDVISKSKLDEYEFAVLFNKIISKISIVPIDEFKPFLQKAYDMMRDIDEEDTPFLALALSFDNDGIWSQDAHFEKQNMVKVWKTEELLKSLMKKIG